MTLAEARKKAYVMVREKLVALKRNRDDAKFQFETFTKQVEEMEAMEKEMSVSVCRTCMGYGHVREWLAQDEVRSVKCEGCDGTGLPKER